MDNIQSSTILKIIPIMIIIIVIKFNFDGLDANEYDVLPSALQYFNSNWLPSDWYLNLDIGYRTLFNTLLGPLVYNFGFDIAASIGRIIAYSVFAFAFFSLLSNMNINYKFILLILVFFLFRQHLKAFEWMVGGVDTKTFAYSFALLSLSSIIKKKYYLAFIFSGAAISFHVLIGIYSVFCLLLSFIGINYKQKLTISLNFFVKSLLLFSLTGFYGLLAIFSQLISILSPSKSNGWILYTNIRVPHHVNPSYWGGSAIYFLIPTIAIITILHLYLYKNDDRKIISLYAISSFFLFLIGIAIHLTGKNELLKYYWFRYPDVILVLFSYIQIFSILQYLFRNSTSKNLFLRVFKNSNLVYIFSMTLLLFFVNYTSANKSQTEFEDQNSMSDMFKWIKNNTEKESIFLINPSIKSFYTIAERAQFVSFKHSPQSANDLEEWYKRMVLCNGKKTETRGYHFRNEIQKNYSNLTTDNIIKIAKKYKLDYFLTSSDNSYNFKLIKSINGNFLYKIIY